MRKILENGFPNSFPLNRQHETPHGPNRLAGSYRFSQVQNYSLRIKIMPKYHYVSRRYYKPWADNARRVCVLSQQHITPFKTPTYWNDDNKKTPTSNIAVKSNYSFTEENENKVTSIETKGNDIIESILKNKVLPNEVEIDPLYKLSALFLSNNPTFRGGIKCTAIGFLDHTLKEDCATIQSH